MLKQRDITGGSSPFSGKTLINRVSKRTLFTSSLTETYHLG